MVDREFLAERATLLLEYSTDLEGYAGTSFGEPKENKVLRRFIERTLHLAVEACLDIGNLQRCILHGRGRNECLFVQVYRIILAGVVLIKLG